MLTGTEINILGNIIDTTWGRSSQLKNKPASCGLKWQLLAEGKMLGTYSSIIHLSSFPKIAEEKKRERGVAETAIDSTLKDIKTAFKEEAGRTLKTKELQTDDSVEPFNSVPGPALFRFKVTISME